MRTLFIKSIIKPFIAMITIAPSILVSPVVDLIKVVEILCWLFLFDLVSGIIGSYFEWKKTAVKDKWFFGNGEGFSSDKFKKCFVKLIVYAGSPLILLRFQETFLIKNFKIKSISDSEMNITVALLLVFCANEIFSIFWENLPKSGINIPKSIKDFVVKIKDFKKEITQ